jgi:hypothetical protein
MRGAALADEVAVSQCHLLADFETVGQLGVALADLGGDTLLCIDEMGQASEADSKLAKKLQTTAFTLASGRGRIRSKAYDQSVGGRDLDWSLLFLSTGEKAIADIATEGAMKRLKGEEVRFIDLPALADPVLGVFERLPEGFSDPAKFAESIEAACREHHGIALRAFVWKPACNFDPLTGEIVTGAKVRAIRRRSARRSARGVPARR